ncbi:MAG TPA: amidohydrolase [Candidatus Limnocylindrales bacterium]|nr:amidohydrolase [Candidatus Limnocylindrales bacterium]
MYADLVFLGGKAFVEGAPRPLDVAVRRSTIVATGDISDLVGPSTEVVPVGDGLLIPGIQDAHVHPVWAGLEAMRCNLSGLSGLAALREKIDSYVRARPGGGWVTGGGWLFPSGTPKACDLDDIVPDRPVFLYSNDHHAAWVNSVALRLAGIDRYTPDPHDGRLERDAHGNPTGVLHEGAMALVAELMPPAGPGDYAAALRYAQAHLHSLGVTGWQDAILGEYAGYLDPSPAYRALAASGELTARVCGALWWERHLGLEQVPDLIGRRTTNALERFATPMVKIMLDGVVENFTAALAEPYLHGHGHGLSFVDDESLRDAVKALDAAGFGVHFHAIGDAAVRSALDAVAASGRTAKHRHQIAHLQVVNPADVPRFAELGVVPNIQAYWATHEPQLDMVCLPALGQERTNWLYPFGDLSRSGAVLAMGSDWPVTTADPWQAMHVAVNRALPEALLGQALRPEQGLSLSTALTAATLGSAEANGCREAGTIAVGHHADLVVLDRDPFIAPAAEIGQTRVTQTFVGGQRVYGVT